MSWNQVRGHDRLIEAFDEVVRRGRLAHAYLFSGPRGIGKHLFALELSKALLCETESARLMACDACTSCRLFDAGTHPDFASFARPEDRLEFPVEVAQEVARSLVLMPARGRRKLVVLDDADDLNEESANCLLKTLEEPPPHSVLILIGTSPERQLRTIVSRTQVIRFQPLPPDTLKALLQEQGVTLADNDEWMNGSVAGALDFADAELTAFRHEFVSGIFSPKTDAVKLARRWMELLDDAGKDAALHRRRSALIIQAIVDFLSDALRVSAGQTSRATNADVQQRLADVATRFDAEQIVSALERCLEADTQIERRAQLVLIVEGLVDALCEKFSPAPAR